MSSSGDGTRSGGETPSEGNTPKSSPGNHARHRAPSPEPSATRTGDGRGSADSRALLVHDIVSSVVAVFLVGAFLFAASGVWPPLVAVESGSMYPNLQVNDLVFIMDENRFPGDGAVGNTGVVTYEAGKRTGYTKFGKPGDVIVFAPRGNERATPIIHRAMFWVEDGENWYDRANPAWIGSASSCSELPNCPALHAGFITKGDNNPGYDQAGLGAYTGPVKPEWIIGTAEYRIPFLGWIRLSFV